MQRDYDEDITHFPKWQRVRQQWLPKQKQSKLFITAAEIEQINFEVNSSIRYEPDQADHWQTPSETLARGAGDCEDIALVKFHRLVEVGFNPDDIELVICNAKDIGEIHAVLLVHNEYGSLVLDNRRNYIAVWNEFILNHQPLYAINWLGWRRL